MSRPYTSAKSAIYFRKKTSGGRAYLQIVESRRVGAQVRQQVIATLGRVQYLRESGIWNDFCDPAHASPQKPS
jgi:hypothetical protein